MRTVPFYLHDLGQAEVDSVARVVAGPILTTGQEVADFERGFGEYLGCPHVIGVTSGTAALHLALLALGVSAGDEVITTPLTFIATATAIIQAGATPVFVDVEPGTGNMDASLVEGAITARTRAIIAVHLYGQMCDMLALRSVADRHGLALVEDAAHCVEGSRNGIRPGQLGEAACFSFYATKSLTSGEGGAVATRSPDLDARLRKLRHHGMTKTAYDRASEGYTHWDMVTFGWKYNMDNVHAALLRPQLRRIESNWNLRRERAALYRSRLAGVGALSWPLTHGGVDHAHHLFTIWVDAGRRDSLLDDLKGRGIGVAVNYRPIHRLSYFQETLGLAEGSFPVAERIGSQTLTLPLYPRLAEEDASYVCACLEELLA